MEREGRRAALYTVCPLRRPLEEREKVCVWFVGGSAVPAEGLCHAEGDLRESASERKERGTGQTPITFASRVGGAPLNK
jgi:hypothetical protein